MVFSSLTKQNASGFFVYALSLLFVMGWWLLAFQSSIEIESEEVDVRLPEKASSLSTSYGQLVQILSPLDRKEIHAALNGDADLMVKLIGEWDIDAQILEGSGIRSIHRLPQEMLTRSHLLDRLLKRNHAAENKQRILPQTYVAASFLLALLPHDQIAAIPRGLRNLTQIYPPFLTDSVPLDTDRTHFEQIFHTKPHLAFVSKYSHPATIQSLKMQGIRLCYLKDIEEVSDVSEVLQEVGSLASCQEKAELLNIFILAGLNALDNRSQAYLQNSPSPPPSVLFANFSSQLAASTEKTLTGKLLNRLGVENSLSKYLPESKNGWSVNLTQEQIIRMDPDFLIIGTISPGQEELFLKNPAFKTLKAVQKKRVFFVDTALHESPTQYVALAYFDLFNALVNSSL